MRRFLLVALLVAVGFGTALGQRSPREIDGLIKSRQYVTARTELLKVLELKPTSAKAHFALAFVLEQLNDLKAARGHLDRALALEPKAAFADPQTLQGLKRRLGIARRSPEAAIQAPSAAFAKRPSADQPIEWRNMNEVLPVVAGVLALTGFGALLLIGLLLWREARSRERARAIGLETGRASLLRLGTMIAKNVDESGNAIDATAKQKLTAVRDELEQMLGRLESRQGNPELFVNRSLPRMKTEMYASLNPRHTEPTLNSSPEPIRTWPRQLSPASLTTDNGTGLSDLASIALIAQVANPHGYEHHDAGYEPTVTHEPNATYEPSVTHEPTTYDTGWDGGWNSPVSDPSPAESSIFTDPGKSGDW